MEAISILRVEKSVWRLRLGVGVVKNLVGDIEREAGLKEEEETVPGEVVVWREGSAFLAGWKVRDVGSNQGFAVIGR